MNSKNFRLAHILGGAQDFFFFFKLIFFVTTNDIFFLILGTLKCSSAPANKFDQEGLHLHAFTVRKIEDTKNTIILHLLITRKKIKIRKVNKAYLSERFDIVISELNINIRIIGELQ